MTTPQLLRQVIVPIGSRPPLHLAPSAWSPGCDISIMTGEIIPTAPLVAIVGAGFPAHGLTVPALLCCGINIGEIMPYRLEQSITGIGAPISWLRSSPPL